MTDTQQITGLSPTDSGSSPPTSLSRDGLPNICSIPPGAPFLPTLVDALFDGSLIQGFSGCEDPLALADVTIWVPTRRAARELAGEFVGRFEGDVALLPSIRTLGGIDEDDMDLEDAADSLGEGLNPVVAPAQRQLILSRLVFGWSQSLNQAQRDLYAGADIMMPSSLSDAVWFAAELARLMDTIATEEVDWSQLLHLVPEDHANWWQLTLEFLKIATAQWPEILAELQLSDAADERAKRMRAQASLYKERGSSGPVIAAGSTGSIPATADLLKSIAHLPNGVVVLPALDRDLDNETWEKIDLPDNPRDSGGTAPGHPQYGLKRLLDHLGSGRALQDIVHLGSASETGPMRVRELLVSEALRPPQATGQWQDLKSKISDDQMQQALQDVALVEAENERQEAVAIALALRETLEDPAKTCALVTPDRNLARRVAVEMQRFGVEVDDSSGQPLRNTPVGRFLRLVLLVGFAPPSAVNLVSLLKHPLAMFGDTAARARHAARLFELAVLRGAIGPPAMGRFVQLAEQKHQALADPDRRVHRVIRRFSDNDWQDVFWLAELLDRIFGFADGVRGEEGEAAATVDALTRRSIKLMEACAIDHEGHFNGLYGNEQGRVLADFLSDMLDHGSLLQTSTVEFPDIIDALMAQRVTRPTGRAHPRVAILGPLEARLQTFDRVVLGGLNEKTWPANTRNDAFLSRPMKSALGLPPPERRTGLAAHDFQVLLGINSVLMTRAVKVDNAPAIATRWLQRLQIVAGESAGKNMRREGQVYLDWARRLDQPDHAPRPCAQPRPTPPVEVRPNSLSITDIETWINDPYAIYAKRILKLVSLDPLQRAPDARERGNLYHAIVEDFVRQNIDPQKPDSLERLIELARRRFGSAEIPVEYAVQWWPRFENIAANLVQWQRQQVQETDKIYVELSGDCDRDLDGFVLRGRVDRIDLLKDGRLAIFDYKTGINPNIRSMVQFKSPQLPLEAAMALRGGFGDELARHTAKIGYIRLRPSNELQVDTIAEETKGTPSAAQLSEEAWQRLGRLVAAYREPEKDYRSKARQAPERNWHDDYEHLARVKEWAVTDDQEGDA